MPVRQSEDVSFGDLGDFQEKATADAARGDRTVLYYRNPMGRPDTSPVPKKDSMDMDYIPVFEGKADDSGTVKVSPGKLQRTGVRSVEATLSPIVGRLHTAVYCGQFLEGHVPFEAARMLETRSDLAGLTVPGMPAGSFGMGDDPSASYDVVGVDRNGKTSVFLEVRPKS